LISRSSGSIVPMAIGRLALKFRLLLEKDSGHIDGGLGIPDPEGLAIGKASNSQGTAHPFSTRHFRIKINRGAWP